MDPVSLSASIAGLVTLADLVFRTGTQYVRALRDSRKEVEELLQEVKSLSLLLHSLSLAAFDLEIESANSQSDDTTHLSNLKPHHLYDCKQLLRRLEQGLATVRKDFDSPSGLVRLQRRLKWPFSSDETKNVLQSIQRHKQTINIALASDSIANIKLCLSRQEELKDSVSDLKLVARKILDIETKIFLDQRRRRVLQLFTSFDPRSEFEMSRKLRHPLTGLWLTESTEFDTWYNTPCSRIWCSGIPGAGKSIIAGAIISECLSRNGADANLAVAYVFCTYRDSRTHDPIAILSSLAAQIAQQGEGAYGVLEAYYNKLNSDHSLPAKPTAEALVEAIADMCSTYRRVFLVIDGLDECGSQARGNVRYLTNLAQMRNHETISMALLSRDELFIRQQLEGSFECIHLEAHTEDIQLYVVSELNQRIDAKELRLRDITLKDHILTTLVNGAKGMFRWVACQLDHICELPTDRARREALGKLPPTLFDTYERILLRVEGQATEVRVLVQRSLILISCRFFGGLHARELCDAVSVPMELDTITDEDTVDEAEIMYWCGSLVRKSNDGQKIEFSHFTVQEYLNSVCPTHPRLGAFGTSVEQVDELVASICLRCITLQNYERRPKADEDEIKHMLSRRDQHPFYEKAALTWPVFVYSRPRGPCAEDLSALFNFDKTASFCSWAIELIMHCMSRGDEFEFHEPVDFSQLAKVTMTIISAVTRPDFTPLHMAAVLGLTDVCRKLLHQGADVNLRSQFGTPLHCAIGHLTVFADVDISGVYLMNIEELQPYGSLLSSARRQTTNLLLEAGARTELYLNTPFRMATVLSLPVLASMYGEDFEIVVDLLNAGVTVDEDDLGKFQDRYRDARGWLSPFEFKQIYQGGKAFKNLLEALEGSESVSSPRSRLYAMTLEFVKHMEIDLPPLPESYIPVDMLETYDVQEQHAYLLSAIENNDIMTLGLILKSSRSALVQKLISDNHDLGWTCFHVAVQSKSLDVLEVLLKQGFDANIPADDGRTPVSLCWDDGDEDMLRTFLRYDCSTVIPDNNGETIWHESARENSIRILEILVTLPLPDKDTALQMESRNHVTPIYESLDNGHLESTLLLLPFCNTKAHWPRDAPVFRAAARLGSSKVLEQLVEIRINVDVVDKVDGNPLHDLSPGIDLRGVEILKNLFPIDHRRQKDFRTPFELMLIRSSKENVPIHDDVFEALLTDSLTSTPSDASLLWPLVCSDILPNAIARWPGGKSDRSIVSSMIQKGVTKLFEETQKTCPILPFTSALIQSINHNSSRCRDSLWGDSKSRAKGLSMIHNWQWVSAVFMEIAQDTQLFPEVEKDPSMVQLLSESIIQNDGIMISFLLEKGVDIHRRENEISPFELACFPELDLNPHNFELILKYSNIEKASQSNNFFDGCGPLHFTAGFFGAQGSVWKLEQLLQFGLDSNFPKDTIERPPLLFHIFHHSLNTAETLLDIGADPWVSDDNGWDAPLTAVARKCPSLLRKVSAVSETFNHTQSWDRTFKRVFMGNATLSGGNALHMSVLSGEIDCLKFYLSNKLICNLDCLDESLQTPMHYAARFGQHAAIKLLSEHGGAIAPIDRYGMTPLHVAAQENHLSAVEILIELGAEVKICSAGCSPLAYAYMSGCSEVIKALERYEQRIEQETREVSHPKVARMMSNAMMRAIRNDDLDACKGLLQAGCSADIELSYYGPVTPLMATIHTNQSQSVAQYLLEMGAAVSTVFDPPYCGEYFTILEAALVHGRNDILPALIMRYFQEAPNLNSVPRSPLHVALLCRNFDGFKMLLDFMQRAQPTLKTSKSIISGGPIHSFEVDDVNHFPRSLMNQRDQLSANSTPLHVAAELGYFEATKALIESTNAIEDKDFHKRTPLHRAAMSGSTEVVELLLNHGSRIDALTVDDNTPLMVACINFKWKTASFLLERSSQDCVRRLNHQYNNPLSLTTQTNDSYGIQMFHKILDLGFDIHESQYNGWSAAYGLLLGPMHNCLRSLLNRHPRLLTPVRMYLPSSWPMTVQYNKLPHIARALRLLSRCDYTAEELRNIVGLATMTPDCPEKHNLICQAARLGFVEALRDFGAAFGCGLYKLQCCDHGTLFDAALARQELDVIKFLVRDCAVEVTFGGGGMSDTDTETNVLHDQDIDLPILRWLLVDRYTDQPKLTLGDTDPGCGMGDGGQTHEHATYLPIREGVDREVTEPIMARQTQRSRWVHTVELPLRFEWRQRRDETMFQYAIRRQAILRDIRKRQ